MRPVQIEVLDHWRSPTGVRYPSHWRLRVPSQRLDLTITPYLADQELDVGVRYWEGAVRIAGTAGSQPVAGKGYVELTGYGDAPASAPIHSASGDERGRQDLPAGTVPH